MVFLFTDTPWLAWARLAQQQMLAGGTVARVIRERCSRCLTCVCVCPFEVPKVTHPADAAKCLGCGLCTGECPMGAIELMHHRESQLGAEIRAVRLTRI